MGLDTSFALPIDEFQKTIEETIEKNPITIITAETGAGKSTRVPLWLWQKGKKVHITQPRRIAARSLSFYLTRSTGSPLGQKIGYQTGFDSRKSRETTLLYVTDGVQMVQEIKESRDYDVLILDEVHEWNLNQEVLVGIVKKNLERGFYRQNRKKVVIMSATLQAGRLADFLGSAPVISISGRGFPVTLHHNHPHFILPDTAQMVELERNVLVFQPGKGEIDAFIENLERMLAAEKTKAKIMPLHAELPLKEQANVFLHFSVPKVVVATDIAQTSLTIDDIDAVVDCGIKKEVRVIKGIEGLYPVEISYAECMQRAGRAGRVKPGQYFLCADMGMKDRLPFPEPEIRRLNLECVVLRLIKKGISPLDFPFFHSPSKALIFKAIKKLKIFGAITEEEKITAEGSQMAEYPVSLRSAKLLLEAGKAGSRVLDQSIKLIAILETRGITAKEYTGEKFANLPYNSDLLNQWVLWEGARRNRKIINQKKFALAREIYQELKKRLSVPEVGGPLTPREIKLLYRALLSSFGDEVHIKIGEEYQRENEVRQLEKTSILFTQRPEMIVGLPFDLVINRENRETGDMEEKFIPLVTFASEITLDILEDLKPYGYSRTEAVSIKNSRLTVRREYFFGGKSIKVTEGPPDLQNERERELVVNPVLNWYDNHQGKFGLQKQEQALENIFGEITALLPDKCQAFGVYWRKFLFQEIKNHIKHDDLNIFFHFHPGFSHITFGQLLPAAITRGLSQAHWPSFLQLGSDRVKVHYIQGKPFLRFDYADFEKVKEEDIILPTGERPTLMLGNRRFTDWKLAAHEFNRWKRLDVFEKKLRENKTPGNIADMMDIPYPQPLTGGRGKDNTPLEYYCAPDIQGEQLFLKYFLDRESAEAWFIAIQAEWEQFIKNYKKSKLDNIFKQKGWKVKP